MLTEARLNQTIQLEDNQPESSNLFGLHFILRYPCYSVIIHLSTD